jgi:hypothetical protein
VNARYTEENYYPYYVSQYDARAYYLQLLEQYGVTEADLLAAGIDLDSIDWNNLDLDDLDIPSLIPMLVGEPQVVSTDDGGYKVVARYALKPDKSDTGKGKTQQSTKNTEVVGDDANNKEDAGLVTSADITGPNNEAQRAIEDLRRQIEDAYHAQLATEPGGDNGENGGTTNLEPEPVEPDPNRKTETDPVVPGDMTETSPVEPDPDRKTETDPVVPGDMTETSPVEPDPDRTTITDDVADPTPEPEPDPQEYYKPQEDEPIYEDVYTIDFDDEGMINNFSSDVSGAPVENPDDYTTYAEPVPEQAEPTTPTDSAPITEPSTQTEPAPTTTPTTKPTTEPTEDVEQNTTDESQSQVGQEAASRVVMQRSWFMRNRG